MDALELMLELRVDEEVEDMLARPALRPDEDGRREKRDVTRDCWRPG